MIAAQRGSQPPRRGLQSRGGGEGLRSEVPFPRAEGEESGECGGVTPFECEGVGGTVSGLMSARISDFFAGNDHDSLISAWSLDTPKASTGRLGCCIRRQAYGCINIQLTAAPFLQFAARKCISRPTSSIHQAIDTTQFSRQQKQDKLR